MFGVFCTLMADASLMMSKFAPHAPSGIRHLFESAPSFTDSELCLSLQPSVFIGAQGFEPTFLIFVTVTALARRHREHELYHYI